MVTDFGRCLTARAATPSGLSRFASSCKHRIAIAWRKCCRSPYTRDMRLIDFRYRHLYRAKFETGSTGDALNGLWLAYHAKHLRSQISDSGSRPQGRDVKQARGEARQSGAKRIAQKAGPND